MNPNMNPNMNPYLARLQPYPFERLRGLLADLTPANVSPINLSIGEPKHATPPLIQQALLDHLSGLASYPTTLGIEPLRQTIQDWLQRRYGVSPLNLQTQILPINGSREALFSLTQTIINAQSTKKLVLSPNPFYQIYEGATYLAGGEIQFLNRTAATQFKINWASVSEQTWQNVALVFVCSPDNPTGQVMSLAEWETLFELSDRYDFVIVADECYSEIYCYENQPPLGALQAAYQLGRQDYRNLIMVTSLSKRSNVPGMRSGFVAGDAQWLKPYLLYRTYHGCAMNPAVQHASIAAWQDEAHVQHNRALYQQKFAAMVPRLAKLSAYHPDAGFYIWAKVPDAMAMSDTDFVRCLYQACAITALPGSFLARDTSQGNPGAQYVRLALVDTYDACIEAADRMVRAGLC
jgi:N-succinyldiaminopimelate aminotransferase